MKSGDRSEMRQRGQRVTDGKQGDRGEEDVWKKKIKQQEGRSKRGMCTGGRRGLEKEGK